MADITRRTKGFKYRPEPKQYSGPRPCWVYFVTTEEVPGYPVKIGMSIGSVESRLRSLQTGCPYKLVVLASIKATTELEWMLHKELHAHRLEGEWFRRSPEVMAEVKRTQRQAAKRQEDKQLKQQAWDNLPETVREKVMANIGITSIKF